MDSTTLTKIPTISIPPSGRSGRWIPSPTSSGSLTASWCSASLEFLFSGNQLKMSIGQGTARKAQPNGGTQMIAIITGPSREEALLSSNLWRTLDLEPGSDIVVFDEKRKDMHEKTFVKIVLIDWASRVEIEGFLVEEEAFIEPVPILSSPAGAIAKAPKILVIGDSISAGYAISTDQGGERVPYGCLNTFPFVAQRVLLSQETRREVKVDMIAYPGLCLVHPTAKELEEGFHPGMAKAFFWESIWNNQLSSEIDISSPTVIMIQLGNNDQSLKISPERFQEALIHFMVTLQNLSNGSIRHIWLVPPFPDADVPDYKEINNAMPSYVQALAEKFGDKIQCRICDLADGLTTEDTVDGAHPPVKVHEELGKKLAGFIEEILF